MCMCMCVCMCVCSRVVIVMCCGDDALTYQSLLGGKQLSSSRQVLLLKLFEKRSSPRVQRWSIVPGVSVPIPDDLTTGRKGREWPGEGEGSGPGGGLCSMCSRSRSRSRMESLTHEDQSAERQSPRAQRGSNVPGVSVPIPNDLTTGRRGRE